MSQSFRPHPIYYILLLLLLILAGLLLWGMRDGITGGDVLFLGIVLGAVGYFIVVLTTSLVLTDHALYIGRTWRLWNTSHPHQPQPVTVDNATVDNYPEGQRIAFRQLISVERSGRLFSVLTVLYHPMQDDGPMEGLGQGLVDGLVDIERIEQVTLPMVVQQAELQEHLERGVPLHSKIAYD